MAYTDQATIVPHAQDPAIDELLQEARRLQAAHEPIFTWEQLMDIILGQGRLGELVRHPTVERAYEERFNPALRKAHGSVAAYLRAQLRWEHHEVSSGTEYWIRTAPARVRLNDWAYSVPKDVVHYVVWVPTPLFHADLCRPVTTSTESSAPPTKSVEAKSDSDSWEQVKRNGLGGRTGAGGESNDDVGPEREIMAFVKERWSEEEYDTLWFANPPELQSVRDLAHFHVLVRHKDQLGRAELPN
ncbi:BZ3500_MvSof-1268-A1-R1_Chr3-3g06380 [Microbotryum saponariae]|uniref:BZ3500_MvSof-1268-A1-R1_Chr3-3g06380 protein n=1 Tax=Microbotryum saponariae TaxID=289078 RepID=A0A2X0NGV6_9BASI|nr:BZ3500_MvSof-1268-A1-R1_Chr3-3g06380 [Microbotryum saponariae]SDA04347.1 BZ3501_MvSof-1269-A2-R1_Chr3-2g06067 [Microbotryum saponariae]